VDGLIALPHPEPGETGLLGLGAEWGLWQPWWPWGQLVWGLGQGAGQYGRPPREMQGGNTPRGKMARSLHPWTWLCWVGHGNQSCTQQMVSLSVEDLVQDSIWYSHVIKEDSLHYRFYPLAGWYNLVAKAF